jgi:pseudouridine synthase
MPVGRLDLNTEGLLLLTNDGELKRALELPSTGVPRTYRARTFGAVSQAQLEDLMDGMTIDGVRYGPIDANLERRTGRNQWIELTLTEGKNREVRRVLEHLGLQVSRLIRTAYGPFELGDLPRGAAVEVPKELVERFRSAEAEMRIIAGEWRGRKLRAPKGRDHPPDRRPHARNAVLDARQPLGSFEGLAWPTCSPDRARSGSRRCRAAPPCLFVEQDAAALRALRANIAALGAAALRGARRLGHALGPAKAPVDLICSTRPTAPAPGRWRSTSCGASAGSRRHLDRARDLSPRSSRRKGLCGRYRTRQRQGAAAPAADRLIAVNPPFPRLPSGRPARIRAADLRFRSRACPASI